MWNFSDLNIWAQSKFLLTLSQVTCHGDPYLSLTEKPIWSGKATQHILTTARKIHTFLLLLWFQPSWALGTLPGDTNTTRIPKTQESVIPVQACSCRMPVGTSTPLFYASSCVANCQGACRALQMSVAVTDISSHLSVRRTAIHKWESRRESLGRRCCERTPLNFTPSINPSEIAVLHICKYLQNSNPHLCKWSKLIRLTTLTQHCHPWNRWVLTWDAFRLPRLK